MLLQEYAAFLETYTKTFEAIVQDEQFRLSALINHDLSAIEKSISNQQANQLRLQNMEERRMELQEEMGFSEATLAQMITMYEGQERRCLEGLYDRARDAIMLIKNYNQKSNELIQMNLQLIHGNTSKTTGYEQLFKR